MADKRKYYYLKLKESYFDDDAIVERLDGYISRNSEDGAFTTEILLPQE